MKPASPCPAAWRSGTDNTVTSSSVATTIPGLWLAEDATGLRRRGGSHGPGSTKPAGRHIAARQIRAQLLGIDRQFGFRRAIE
jgi:hypothetical protein